MPDPLPARRAPAFVRYAVAVVCALAATGTRLALGEVLGHQFPFVTYFVAVLVTAWVAGFGPAVVAAVLGGLGAAFFFLEPVGSFAVHTAQGQLALAMYALIAGGIVVFGLAMQRAYEQADDHRRRLQDEAATRVRAERQLDRYRHLAEHTREIVLFVRPKDGRIVEANAAAVDAYGYPHDELLRMTVWDLRDPGTSGQVAKQLAQADAAGIRFETLHCRKDGTTFPVEVISRGADVGGERLLLSLIRDVTDRVRSDEAIREGERRYRWLVENTAEAVWRCETDGPIPTDLPADDQIDRMYRHAYLAECNEGMARMYAFASAAAMTGLRLSDIMPQTEPANVAYLRAFVASGYKLVDAESVEVGADGQTRYILNNLIGEVVDGRLVRAFGTSRDVTARRTAEERERLRAEELQTVLRAVPAAVWVAHDSDCRRVTGSTVSYQVLRLSEGGNPSKSAPAGERPDHFRLFRPDGSEFDPADLPLQRAARGERQHGVVECLRFEDGSQRWLFGNAEPLLDPAGRPRGAVAAFMDITDLVAAQDALREADKRKDEFLAVLAHELRNPLAPIRNGLKILQLAGNNPAAAAQARAVMERQLSHMVRLIDDLLDVSRISRNKLVLKRERIDLTAAVQSAVEASRPVIDAAGLTLSVSAAPGPIPVDGDLTRLAQVFTNLLNNAAKFTDRGGHVTLTVTRDGGEAAVAVRDTGVGIPADLLPKVFDPFHQADRTLERSRGGLGIGLTLVRSLVELHGGRVEVHSDGPGTGSTFVVRLPLRTDEGGGVKDETQPASGSSFTPPPSSLRVLVADDNQDAVDSLAALLGMLGHEVRTAADGDEAVRAAGEFRPEVAILDIGMPRMNGYDAARQIRGTDWGRGLVLVALTGWGQDEDRRKSREAGFDHHLVKPVDSDELRAVLPTARGGRPPGP